MPGYLIANVKVTDPEGFERYRAGVPAVIAQYGGRYAVRGGTMEKLENAEGFNRMVVLEFPAWMPPAPSISARNMRRF